MKKREKDKVKVKCPFTIQLAIFKSFSTVESFLGVPEYTYYRWCCIFIMPAIAITLFLMCFTKS